MQVAEVAVGVELVDDTRASLALNVAEELACEALVYRLERLLAAASSHGERVLSASSAGGGG